MGNGKVIFTVDFDFEISRIQDLSKGAGRKFYVYGKYCPDISPYQQVLPDFSFIKLEESYDPRNSFLLSDNCESDFFVLKYPRCREIMDRNIEMFQTFLKGYKLIVEEHPFIGKKEVYWCYFPWSFFNKSILGYPHCYAFQRAKFARGVDPHDCAMLASKVADFTDTSIQVLFKDDIETKRVMLGDQIKEEYQSLKSKLFQDKLSPWAIIRDLKKFVNSRDPIFKRGFNLLNINKCYDQYKKGERLLLVSDAKVDAFLESQFRGYISNVNTFMKALWYAKGI